MRLYLLGALAAAACALLLACAVPCAYAARVKGDVNGNGQVDLGDAILALRIAVGIVTPDQEQVTAADVSPYPGVGQLVGDGKVQVADAVRILRFVVGLIPVGELTGEVPTYVGLSSARPVTAGSMMTSRSRAIRTSSER
ncbi:MAG: dockerin type I repeat-containing protein [Anaerolineae bacterium]